MLFYRDIPHRDGAAVATIEPTQNVAHVAFALRSLRFSKPLYAIARASKQLEQLPYFLTVSVTVVLPFNTHHPFPGSIREAHHQDMPVNVVIKSGSGKVRGRNFFHAAAAQPHPLWLLSDGMKPYFQ